MPLLEDVADELAKRATDLARRTDDEDLEKKISDEIGASSPTLQEAFRTAMRIRRAELRGNLFMDKYEAKIPKPMQLEAPSTQSEFERPRSRSNA